MNKLEKVRDFFKQNGRMVLVIIFILELILMVFITPDRYDDAYYLGKAKEGDIFEYIKMRYATWSSRLLSEITIISMFRVSKYLWMILEALMSVLICYSMSELFIKDNKEKYNYMLLAMVLLYPMNVMASCGWATTTIVYYWSVALGLYSLIPIKKIWYQEKIKKFEFPLFLLSLLYVANNEQVCALLLGFYLVFGILMILRDKKIHPFMVIQFVVIILSLIFILTCPGNSVRTVKEIKDDFKDMEMLSVLDKFALGLTSTNGLIISGEIETTILMVSLINVYIFTHYKEKLYRIVSMIPLVSIIALGLLVGPENADLFGKVFPFIYSFRILVTSEQVFLTAATSNNLLYALPVIYAFINFICIGLSLTLIFKKLRGNLALLIYLAGLASRMIMGFSPTVFKSGARTMIFFEFAMISIALLIYQELDKDTKVDKKIMNKVDLIIKFSAVIQYLNILFCILFTQK